MDSKTFRKQMVGLTLQISKKGQVSDGIFEYGLITTSGFKTSDGRLIDMEAVLSSKFSEPQRLLILEMINGGIETAVGCRPGTVTLKSEVKEEITAESLEKPEEVGEDDYTIIDGKPIIAGCAPVRVSDLYDSIPALYPDLPGKLYYDVMAEREMVDVSLFREFGSNGMVVPIEDHHLSMYHIDLQKRMREAGLDCRKMPSNQVMDEVFSLMANLDRRNAFRDWLESHEWDQVPRIGTMFQRYFGGTAPYLASKEDEDLYLESVAKAWLIGGVARAYHKTQHDVVPLLISTEYGNGKGQGIGKGQALRLLAGDDSWYRTVNTDVKDEARFLDAARGGLIVELAESTQIRTNDNSTLKYFISKDADYFRKSYGRYSGEYPRHFILVATSNHEQNFTDLTGSRRFYPIICNASIVKDNKTYIPVHGRPRTVQYEVEQIWAEALHLYRCGHRPHVSGRADELAAIMQEAGAVENPGVAYIDSYLDDPQGQYFEIGSKVTKEIIMRDLFNCVGMPTVDMERAWRAWKDGSSCWKSKQFRNYETGKTTRGFVRITAPGTTANRTVKLNLVDAKVYEEDIEPRILAEMDEVTRRRVLGIHPEAYLEEDEYIVPDDNDFEPEEYVEIPGEQASDREVIEEVKDPHTIMNNLLMIGAYTGKDQRVDVEVFGEEAINALVENGWIYDLGLDGEHEYYVNRMP